jgi:hypothetical protein
MSSDLGAPRYTSMRNISIPTCFSESVHGNKVLLIHFLLVKYLKIEYEIQILQLLQR